MEVVHQIDLETSMLGKLEVAVDVILVLRQQSPNGVLKERF